MKKYDIVTAKKYTKNGEEKTQWNNVGSLVYFPADEEKEKKEGYALELSMFPETKFMVFEKKVKDEPKNTMEIYNPSSAEMKANSPYGENYPVEGENGIPNPDDIPF